MRYRSLVFLVLLVLMMDLISKQLTVAFFRPGESLPLFSMIGIDVGLGYVTNRGAAWGMFQNWQQELVVLRILFVGLLSGYLVKFAEKEQRFFLALIIAGATGNLIDVYLYGHVVDMIHIVFWGWGFPLFNVADSAISIGVLLALKQGFR